MTACSGTSALAAARSSARCGADGPDLSATPRGAGPRARSCRNRPGRHRLQSGVTHRDAEERMRHSTLLPRQDSVVYRSCRAADDDRTTWAVVEDVALGGALCLALWFFTSMAFLA